MLTLFWVLGANIVVDCDSNIYKTMLDTREQMWCFKFGSSIMRLRDTFPRIV